MDEQFEKDLNKKAVESYEIKTSASSILSAYHAKQDEKKRHSYKTPFFVAMGAFGCAAIALAVVIPMALKPNTIVPSSSLIETSLNDLPTSPLKTQKDALGYEVASLYPLLKKTTTATTEGLRRPLRAHSSAPTFQSVVDSYEMLQSPVRNAFEGSEISFTVETASYTWNGETYDQKIVLPEEEILYFSSVIQNNVWRSVRGVIVDEDEVEYQMSGTAQDALGKEGFSLRLQNVEEAGEFALMSQNTTVGVFAFSYNVFKDYQLESHFSIRLLQSEQHYYAHVEYYEEDETASTYGVLRNDSTHYIINKAGFGQFLLSYQNNQRIYTYNGNSITK
jgi:hypothetical protein